MYVAVFPAPLGCRCSFKYLLLTCSLGWIPCFMLHSPFPNAHSSNAVTTTGGGSPSHLPAMCLCHRATPRHIPIALSWPPELALVTNTEWPTRGGG